MGPRQDFQRQILGPSPPPHLLIWKYPLWAFDSLFCPEGRVFVHNDCPRESVFAPFKTCPGGGGGLSWIKLTPALTEHLY